MPTPAQNLWTAVKARYESNGLITLTNVRDRSATTINDSVGEQASQDVIDLFPAYAQATYDETNGVHVQAGVMGVIALLWRRGGSASTIEQVKWDEVFGEEGFITRLRNIGARSRIAPSTNSGSRPSSEILADGQRRLPWSDERHFPGNIPVPAAYRPNDR